MATRDVIRCWRSSRGGRGGAGGALQGGAGYRRSRNGRWRCGGVLLEEDSQKQRLLETKLSPEVPPAVRSPGPRLGHLPLLQNPPECFPGWSYWWSYDIRPPPPSHNQAAVATGPATESLPVSVGLFPPVERSSASTKSSSARGNSLTSSPPPPASPTPESPQGQNQEWGWGGR